MRKEAIRELENNIHIMGEIDPSEFQVKQPPAVTIYLPIHHTEREGRRDEQDRIEFKDLSKKAIKELQAHWSKDEIKPIVEKLEFIETHEDLDFWLCKTQGLAFLLNGDECYVYCMDGQPAPLVTVGDKFDMAPIFGEAVRDQALHYKMLLLNTDFFALLKGDANSIHFMELPDKVKHFFAETYPEFDGETTALDYYSLEDHESPYHDHKSRNEVTQKETEKFFRYVNKELSETVLKDNDEPVILVTAPEHVHMFKDICSFELYPKVIEKDPRGMSGEQLRKAALDLLEK